MIITLGAFGITTAGRIMSLKKKAKKTSEEEESNNEEIG
jgi:hypothetical protein